MTVKHEIRADGIINQIKDAIQDGTVLVISCPHMHSRGAILKAFELDHPIIIHEPVESKPNFFQPFPLELESLEALPPLPKNAPPFYTKFIKGKKDRPRK